MAGPSGLLRQMSAYRSDLEGQRDAIQNQIVQLGEAMQTLGGSSAPKSRGGGGRRVASTSFRKGSVKGYILKVLRSSRREMAVKDIAVAVRKAGYRTNSNNFPNQVSNALAQMAGVTKVGRGCYRM